MCLDFGIFLTVLNATYLIHVNDALMQIASWALEISGLTPLNAVEKGHL